MKRSTPIRLEEARHKDSRRADAERIGKAPLAAIAAEATST